MARTRKPKTPETVSVVALTHFATVRQGFTSGRTYTISGELAEDLLNAGLVEISAEPASEVETASEPASEVETASAPNATDVQPDPDPADDAENSDSDD